MFLKSISLVLIGGALALSAQQASVTDNLLGIMNARAKELGLTKNIHTFPPANNGAREFDFRESVTSGSGVLDSGYTLVDKDGRKQAAKYRTEEDAALARVYCKASTVVLASFVGSESHLSTGDTLIYSIDKFEVRQILKPTSSVLIGSDLNVVKLGGEVTDQGEKLRMNVAHSAQFKPNQQYLLFVSPLANAPGYFESASRRVEASLRGDHLFPANDEPDNIISYGEKISTLTKQLDNLQQENMCKD